MHKRHSRISRRAFTLGSCASILAAIAPTRAFAIEKLSWEKRASMPYKVQEIYPALLEDKIHVVGGFTQHKGIIGVTAKHLIYDPCTDLWGEKAPMPVARHHPYIVAHKGKLFALGGFEASARDAVWMMHEESWVYNPKTDTWGESVAAPERHAETVSVSLGERIHVIGGRGLKGTRNKSYWDHTDTDRHLVFDPTSGFWQKAAPALRKRNSAAGAVINGLIYVAGGRSIKSGNIADLEIYDPQEDKWRNGAPMPQAQGGLAAAALDGKLYVFGGEYFHNGGGVYPECWAYDPATDQWKASVPMLTPRHGLGGVAINGWIYAIGGAHKKGLNDTSNVLERFQQASPN